MINNEQIKDYEPNQKKSQNNINDKTSDNQACLLNTNQGELPRNKRCPVTNMKFKQCCGKLA